MSDKKPSERVTHDDLEKLERATAEAFSILAGLLAEAVGSGKLAAHFAATLEAKNSAAPNPLRDKLLKEAYRSVLIKAHNAHSDSEVIRALYDTEFGEQTYPKH